MARVTGRRLAYEIDGQQDAPVLVLGGSLGTTSAMWEPQLPALTRRFRVIRYDHLGHGRSEVPAGPYTIDLLGRELVALLDALSVTRFSYVGLSLGGMLGLWVGSHLPGRVERLALLCTSARPRPAAAWTARAATVRAQGMARVADTVVQRWFTPAFTATHKDVVAAHRAMLVSTPPEGYASCCEAIATLDLRPHLGSVRSPTLVVAGADDMATPPEHAEAIAAALPSARLAVVDRAAHLVSVERTREVTQLLVQHLSEEYDRG